MSGTHDRPRHLDESLVGCVSAVGLRMDGGLYLGAMGLAGILFGGVALGVPAVVSFALVAYVLRSLTSGPWLRTPVAATWLLGLAFAPVVAGELLNAAILLAGLRVPGATTLGAAVTGWLVLPALSAPVHYIGGLGVRDALARALSGASVRRARGGWIRATCLGLLFGLTMGAGQTLVAGYFAVGGDEEGLAHTNLAFTTARVALGAAPETLWFVAITGFVVSMIAPLASAALAEHDDRLLEHEVPRPRSPTHALVPSGRPCSRCCWRR